MESPKVEKDSPPKSKTLMAVAFWIFCFLPTLLSISLPWSFWFCTHPSFQVVIYYLLMILLDVCGLILMLIWSSNSLTLFFFSWLASSLCLTTHLIDLSLLSFIDNSGVPRVFWRPGKGKQSTATLLRPSPQKVLALSSLKIVGLVQGQRLETQTLLFRHP